MRVASKAQPGLEIHLDGCGETESEEFHPLYVTTHGFVAAKEQIGSEGGNVTRVRDRKCA